MARSIHEIADEIAKQIPDLPDVHARAGTPAASAIAALKQAHDAGGGMLRQNYLADAQRFISALDPRRDGQIIQRLQAHVVALGGRGGDTQIAHVTPGEMVIPQILQTPEVVNALRAAAQSAGIDLARLSVDSGWNKINPRTGKPEFDFGDYGRSVDPGFDGDPNLLGPSPKSDPDPGFSVTPTDGWQNIDPGFTPTWMQGSNTNPDSGNFWPGNSVIPVQTFADAGLTASDASQQIAGSLANGHLEDIKNGIRNIAGDEFNEDELNQIAHSFADNTSDSTAAGGQLPWNKPTVDRATGAVKFTPYFYNHLQNNIALLPSDLRDRFNKALQGAVDNGTVQLPPPKGH